jgi:WD40 repeat protein
MSSCCDNVCIITTTKPPSILHQSSSNSNTNSSIQIFDPQTGSIISTSDQGGGGGSSSSSNNINTPTTSSSSAACIKISAGAGVHSLQPILFGNTSHNLNGNEHLYIAYGNQYKNKSSYSSKDDHDDMYAYLLVQGGGGGGGGGLGVGSSSSSSPKWKCKLPELMTSNLVTSPCGYYILGGGKSGTCYCWSTLSNTNSTTWNYDNTQNNDDDDYASFSSSSGSELVSKWVAHYRSIKSIIFSDCGSYVITGGDDGIVNVWNLMDVVSSSSSLLSSRSSSHHNNTLDPIQTWSEHHLPITSMYALPSSRIVSTSKDKQVIIMELFNGQTLAKINMPSPNTTIISDPMGYRLYLGSIDGTIYCVDLNTFAIATTAESATIITHNHVDSDDVDGHTRTSAAIATPSISGSLLEETVLGMKSNDNASSHITEFRGHNRPISCLALVGQDYDINGSVLLVSGSVDGSIRVWDIRSRCCLHTVCPWSTTNILGQEKEENGNNSMVFPCSSITVIPREWIENSDDGVSGVFTSLGRSSG